MTGGGGEGGVRKVRRVPSRSKIDKRRDDKKTHVHVRAPRAFLINKSPLTPCRPRFADFIPEPHS